MNKDIQFSIRLADEDGAPLRIANVLLEAVLYVQGRKRYQFYAGTTDREGRFDLTFTALEEQRLNDQAFAIMDYNTPIADCDSRIDVLVPSPSELEQQKVAIQKWFPENVDALSRIENSSNRLISCSPVQIELVGDESRRTIDLTCSIR